MSPHVKVTGRGLINSHIGRSFINFKKDLTFLTNWLTFVYYEKAHAYGFGGHTLGDQAYLLTKYLSVFEKNIYFILL
jgi:hypothetical protein